MDEAPHHHHHQKKWRFHSRELPYKVNLIRWMPPVLNQEDIGSCSANAMAGILEYLIKRKYKHDVSVSRLFMYYNARRLDIQDATMRDYGATLTSTAKAVRLYGDCEEYLWPYDISYVDEKPGPDVYEVARQYTVIPMEVPIKLEAIKTTLAHGLPVIIGIVLRYSAGKEAKKNDGRINIPNPEATTVRNSEMHAVVIIGYDDRTNHFLVRNSWGEKWGLQGYFYLPYDYLTISHLVNYGDSAWTIQDILIRDSHLPTIRVLYVPEDHKEKQVQHKPHRERHERHKFHKNKHEWFS